jgi:hypothetical protein
MGCAERINFLRDLENPLHLKKRFEFFKEN